MAFDDRGFFFFGSNTFLMIYIQVDASTQLTCEMHAIQKIYLSFQFIWCGEIYSSVEPYLWAKEKKEDILESAAAAAKKMNGIWTSRRAVRYFNGTTCSRCMQNVVVGPSAIGHEHSFGKCLKNFRYVMGEQCVCAVCYAWISKCGSRHIICRSVQSCNAMQSTCFCPAMIRPRKYSKHAMPAWATTMNDDFCIHSE